MSVITPIGKEPHTSCRNGKDCANPRVKNRPTRLKRNPGKLEKGVCANEDEDLCSYCLKRASAMNSAIRATIRL